jgi:hypothetical protein
VPGVDISVSFEHGVVQIETESQIARVRQHPKYMLFKVKVGSSNPKKSS